MPLREYLLCWLVFAANKTDAIYTLSNIEIDDFFTDACQIDIYRIVIAAGS